MYRFRVFTSFYFIRRLKYAEIVCVQRICQRARYNISVWPLLDAYTGKYINGIFINVNFQKSSPLHLLGKLSAIVGECYVTDKLSILTKRSCVIAI